MRIQSGEFRGRKLLSPPRAGTRPITGLAKKSLFDTLGGRLMDAVVLDLYCGTGTIGLEALSRGARLCCFAERDRAVLQRLRRNIEELGAASRAITWQGDVTRRLRYWLDTLDEAIDVAFVDPPYAAARRWDWRQVEHKIFAPLTRQMATDGTVVLRVPGNADAPDAFGELELQREKVYGDMHMRLYAPSR
jgi:16S rRNA (guanine966-N2)-methyltransferase